MEGGGLFAVPPPQDVRVVSGGPVPAAERAANRDQLRVYETMAPGTPLALSVIDSDQN